MNNKSRNLCYGEELGERVAAQAERSVCRLPGRLQDKLNEAFGSSEGLEKKILGRILENIEAAGESGIPLCQDTGVFEVWILAGKEARLSGVNLAEEVTRGVKQAHLGGLLRSSMSEVRPVIHTEFTDSAGTEIIMSPRGFGSENYTFLRMLPPGTDTGGIVSAAAEGVLAAGGRPCPPYVIGIGLGGTASKAVELSVRALAECDFEPGPVEKDILDKINASGLGAGGAGGKHTALGVKLLEFPRHIAGLPLSVHVGCWCNRAVRFRV